jgi:hypothetical protein
MKKLTLNLESLAVQSFPTQPQAGGTQLGTVRANDASRASNCACPLSCPWTGCTDCSCFEICPSDGGA